jgi:multidrug resistance efflux pump
MKNSRLLYCLWIVVLGIVAVILNYNGESTTFYGIADTREIVVNAENAVEIQNVQVVPGQAISKGELLIDFDRPGLSMEINTISHQLEELRANRTVTTEGLQSQIQSLRAQKTAKISEIDYQIKELRAQYAINKELASDLKSIEKGNEDKGASARKSPIQIKIESLEKSLALAVNPLKIEIARLVRELTSTEDPFRAREERLEKELNLLLDEKNRLYIFAPVTGIIGSVNIKRGEKIAPFTPLLTLHPKSPSNVKGYVHENLYNQVALEQGVTIRSLTSEDKETRGEVVGVGSRIVEFPVRLRKRPDLQVWGREVEVKIPEDNTFLLGEKVLIIPSSERGQSYWARLKNSFALLKTHANDETKKEPSQKCEAGVCEIVIPTSLRSIANIEASGVTYLKDIKKYLVISDDTAHKKPVLYLMNDEGIIEEEVSILGLTRINDMEAVTESDDGVLYVACSQSVNKKGKLPQERKLLVRFTRDRTVCRLDKKIYLFDLLADAAKRTEEAPWAEFINSRDKTVNINVEGMFCRGGDLYLGLRSPLLEEKAVVLRIENSDRVFEENALDEKGVSLWKTFALKDDATKAPMGISDLYVHKNMLLILSYADEILEGKPRGSGNLWAYDFEEDQLSFLKHFADLKPEGITFNPDRQEFLITSDHDNKLPSKIMKLRNLS